MANKMFLGWPLGSTRRKDKLEKGKTSGAGGGAHLVPEAVFTKRKWSRWNGWDKVIQDFLPEICRIQWRKSETIGWTLRSAPHRANDRVDLFI
jgi:hypothetical protein